MHRFYSYIFLLVMFVLILSCQSVTKDKEINSSEETSLVNTSESESKIKDERMTWQKPEQVIAKLGNIKNKTIADLGAGIGYFSFKLLPKCKKVIAIDIDKEAIQILNGFKNTLDDNQKNKLEVRLAHESEPGLLPSEVDIIFIVNTITYIDNRSLYLKNLIRYLKEDGQIFIVDFKSKRVPNFTDAPDMEDRVYMHVLEEELEAAGFSSVMTDDTSLEYQYMITASELKKN